MLLKWMFDCQTYKPCGLMKIGIHTHQAKIKNISVGSLIEVKKVEVKEHTTTPPLRFNQASLIKELDAAGVGRPSTYRSMADMAIQRGYAVMKDRAYHMTDLGNRAVEFLIKYFSFIVFYTATINYASHQKNFSCFFN